MLARCYLCRLAVCFTDPQSSIGAFFGDLLQEPFSSCSEDIVRLVFTTYWAACAHRTTRGSSPATDLSHPCQVVDWLKSHSSNKKARVDAKPAAGSAAAAAAAPSPAMNSSPSTFQRQGQPSGGHPQQMVPP